MEFPKCLIKVKDKVLRFYLRVQPRTTLAITPPFNPARETRVKTKIFIGVDIYIMNSRTEIFIRF